MKNKFSYWIFLLCVATLWALALSADERGGSKDVSVTGEVIESFCYLEMGARGESHRQCGIDCAKKGMPIGLLEEKTNNIYTLMPNKDKTPLPDAIIDKMGRKATVTGHRFQKGDSLFLTVESVK